MPLCLVTHTIIMTYRSLKLGHRLSLILSADAETNEGPRIRGGAPGSSSARLLRDSGVKLTSEAALSALTDDGWRICIQTVLAPFICQRRKESVMLTGGFLSNDEERVHGAMIDWTGDGPSLKATLVGSKCSGSRISLHE